MKIGLFVPCYIDQLYPQVAIATMELLIELGCTVEFPPNQTCCGQPMANSGFSNYMKGCTDNFISNFKGFDYIVAPSGSCVLHVKEHLYSTSCRDETDKIKSGIYELTEFLTDVLKVQHLNATFPYRVGLHNSCHGQRGLQLSSMSELVTNDAFSKPAVLLSMVKGLNLSLPQRVDECCGFGGTFCVFEEAVSVKMGKDRVREHEDNNVDVITSCDISCLMHLEGILRRKGSPVQVRHIAEILNNRI